MGHEPALDAELKKMIPYNIEVEILDILRDKSDLRFKRDAEAKIRRTKKKLVIEKFYPMNLMEKLSMQKEILQVSPGHFCRACQMVSAVCTP